MKALTAAVALACGAAAAAQERATLDDNAGGPLAFSPDGAWLAASVGGKVVLWDVKSAERKTVLDPGSGKQTGTVAFSPDGTRVAAGGSACLVVWDVATGKVVADVPGLFESVNAVCFSADGKTVLGAGRAGSVRLWSAEGGAEAASFTVGTDEIKALAVAPDGRWLAAAGAKIVRIWDPGRKEIAATLEHDAYLGHLAVSPDGKTLASGTPSAVRFWDAASWKEVRKIEGFLSACFSKDGARVLLGGGRQRGGGLVLCDAATLREIGAVGRAHALDLVATALAPDGVSAASADGRSIKLWEFRIAREKTALAGHRGAVHHLAFSPDGKTLATAGADKTVRLWDTATARERACLRGHEEPVSFLAFSRDGASLATAGDVVVVWNPADGTERAKYAGHESPVLGVAFSSDGKKGFSCEAAGAEVHHWDATTGKTLRRFAPDARKMTGTAAIHAVDVSPDGKLLACAGGSPLTVFQLPSGRKKSEGDRLSTTYSSLFFSPDGRTILAVERGGRTDLWDVESGKVRAHLETRDDKPRYAAYSADGRKIVVCGDTVSIWNASSLRRIASVPAKSRKSTSAAFSPDAGLLAVSAEDEPAMLWDLAELE